MKFQSLCDLFAHELADLHNAEEQLIKALPKMAEAATSPDLKQAFETHLEETRGHAQRLEQLIERLEKRAPSVTCKAMKGLIDEGSEITKARGDEAVIDAALIGAAQRVEHYEIAAYGCARTYAEMLGDDEAAQLLEQTLNEEKETDQKLNRLATQLVNLRAAQA